MAFHATHAWFCMERPFSTSQQQQKNFINQLNQQLLSTTSNDALFTYNCLSAKKKYNYNMNGLHARHACVLPPPQHSTKHFYS
jgi:ornithine carbamoyltransferase